MSIQTVWEEASRSFVTIFSSRVHLDPRSRMWKCDCDKYLRRGRCGHLTRNRPVRDAEAKKEYL